MIIVVTGSRGFKDRFLVYQALTALSLTGENHTLYHGGCRGVDQWAEEQARDLGWFTACFEADWFNAGKAAGPIRNQKMIDHAQRKQEAREKVLVLAFWDGKSRGTWDTIKKSIAAGLPVDVKVRP